MKLCDFEEFGLTVLQDAEFHSLGALSHRQDRMLAALYDERFAEALLANPCISCAITSPELAPRLFGIPGVGVCSNPMAMFYRIHAHLLKETSFYGAPFATEISPTARVDRAAHVASGNVRIGARSVIEAGAHILGGTLIGADVVVRSGTVIGGEGFEVKMIDGRSVVVPHAGGVRLGDRVEILCNSHIAKSVFGGHTDVGEDTKIDAMVHIAHNVKIGVGCKIAAGAVVAGSSILGDNVWIGPGAVVSSGLAIGAGAFVCLGSVVTKDVQAGWRVFGVPARRLPAKEMENEEKAT